MNGNCVKTAKPQGKCVGAIGLAVRFEGNSNMEVVGSSRLTDIQLCDSWCCKSGDFYHCKLLMELSVLGFFKST